MRAAVDDDADGDGHEERDFERRLWHELCTGDAVRNGRTYRNSIDMWTLALHFFLACGVPPSPSLQPFSLARIPLVPSLLDTPNLTWETPSPVLALPVLPLPVLPLHLPLFMFFFLYHAST